MTVQLPLGIGLRDSATFDNFVATGNEHIVAALQADTEPAIYIYGKPGTGKTHLLQALCSRAVRRQHRPAYLPLADLARLDPAVLQGMEQYEVVCLDDLQAVAGEDDWETALFHAFNRIKAAGQRLIMTASLPPAGLNLGLADLQSRLSWGPVFQLQPLDDAGKRQALQQRAANRGVRLTDEVAMYLLNHCPRDTASLFELLEQLDQASLVAQRRLTIPFIRQYLNESASSVHGRDNGHTG